MNTEGDKVGVITLGCARNLVDSQEILGRMQKQGHLIVDADQADTVIVNTCSFIEDARKESVDVILDLIELKKQGKIKKIVIAGCLSERYGRELADEFTEVDEIVGIPEFFKTGVPDQVYLTPRHFAYVKICESCYNQCSFCAIPGIKGKFSSREVEAVVSEVADLDQRGTKEINIIGQDITAYGIDLYREKSLARLLRETVKVTKNIEWIRLLYAFPSHITDELLEVMAIEEKLCKYIDIPLQHISDHLLQSMNRNILEQETRDLVHKIREKIPTVSLRTAFIVGLPGETEKDFQELLDFVREFRFEKMGAFIYSREEGTPAYDMQDHVPQEIKEARFAALMQEQQQISQERQKQFIGKTLKVLIDEKQESEENVYIGRSEYDAPDVDGAVYIQTDQELNVGSFANVKITDAYEYDLVGEPV
ncbi:MAG: 30S ribosomal protein S12 methylthiotransferase RimO [Candidatus Omnitrophica bacterium]|nr:30S ribosomal protein S12 methylthiotransferase RimO [Candidatus Omnitrophota bacterium]